LTPDAEALQPLLGRASADLQGGRPEEAERIYRDVLARAPEHPVATHFLGVCLVQTGRREEGLAALARSMRVLGGEAKYRHNYALMLAQAGELAAAERELEAAIGLDPGSAASHGYLGIVRQQLGRLDDAAAAYRAALERAPDDPFIANNYGYCLLETGEPARALEWFRRSIDRAPRTAVTHNNQGSALYALDDVPAAIAAYRKAVELDPRYATAWFNLGRCLREVADDGAFDAFRNAVRHGPQFAPAWQGFADEFARARFAAWDARAAQELAQVLLHPAIDAGPLAEAAASLVMLDPGFAPALREVPADAAPAGRWFSGGGIETVARPLLLALIESSLVPEPALEGFLRALRQRALEAWAGGALDPAPRVVELVCALAHQCFLNEYVWPETGAETAAVARLDARVRAGGASALELALLAAYRPLAAIPARARPAAAGEPFERLWRRQVAEPVEEARLRAGIPSITAVTDETSRAVQAQYEENPYPRWHRIPGTLASAYPLRRALRTLFPHLDLARFAIPESPDILIAGCGTGFQAAITAARNPAARILAVDLSRASLAYAMRRCAELKFPNLRFAHADLLELGGLEERFDMIECTGVLHHLRDPRAGWRILASLLKRGGVMKVALYSQRAREGVLVARELIAAHGLGADLDGIRAARQLVFAEPETSPLRRFVHSPDFYSASGVRDLLFHVQEHRFDAAELASSIRALGLEFLGFELADRDALRRYRQRFPDDPAAVALENWRRFEADDPQIFTGMYQFWVGSPVGATASGNTGGTR
jgi:Tfp pilus assembly protein PilF/SAM-dependent methyltransferase